MYEYKIERYGPLAPVINANKEPPGEAAFYDGGRALTVEFAVTTDSTAKMTVSDAEGIYFGFGGTGISSRKELEPYVKTAVLLWRRAYQDFESEIPLGEFKKYVEN